MSGSMTGGIDSSIALRGGQGVTQQVNPLQMMGQYQQIQNGMNANKLFQAQQATGAAYQNAIDPNTGALDVNALRRGVAAAGPAAAPAAAAAMQSAQGLSDQQLAQAFKKLDFVHNAASGLLVGGNITDQAIQGIFQQGVASGVMTPDDVQRQMATIPPDQAGRVQWAQQHRYQAMQMQQQLEMQYGKKFYGDTGGGIQGITQDPRTGVLTASGPPVGKSTSPETNAALVEVSMPDPNRPGSYLKVMVPRSSLPGASGVAGQPSAMGSGAYPAAPTGAPPGAALAAPPQGVTEGNAADVDLFKKDQAAVPAANTNVQNLQHAYAALQLTSSGPSTDAVHKMYSLLAAQNLLPAGLKDDVKNYDEFKKYTERYAMQAASNTDAGRSMSAASNAGTSLSTAANMDVLRNEIGLQRQKVAQVMGQQDPSGVGYGGHVAQFSSATDPRGFAIDTYSPQEVQKMLAGMKSDTERNKFLKSVGVAKRLGLVGQTAQ